MSDADHYTLETPENIELRFDIAGLGTRFCAIVIDHVPIVILTIALTVLAYFVFSAWLQGPAGAMRLGMVSLSILVTLMFGYFLVFEWLMRGQTPGKKIIKIRVIRDDGTPVTIYEVFVRNVLRLVDFLPGFYTVGVLFMFPSRLCRRLGDIAAGTIVIKEEQLNYRAWTDQSRFVHMEPLKRINAELTLRRTAADRRLPPAPRRTDARGPRCACPAAGISALRKISRRVRERRGLPRPPCRREAP